ncbi:MAG: hypothetical protein H0U75_11465 [Legionella sp.]|nr:hypothetical protein [Legionella sp.]
MLNLNKTAVAVLVALSSSTFAGTMGPVCTPGNVTVPCETVAWDLGVTALYLEPIYNGGFDYFNSTTDGVTTSFNEYDHNRDRWDWAFNIEASYHWGYGSDININWYHLDTDHRNHDFDAFTAGSTDFGAGAFNRETRWNAVNGEFAQFVRFSENKTMRFHGGVQYANIRTEDNIFSGATATTVATDYFRRSEFDGVGPRTGLDMNYATACGLGFRAKSAVAILVGRSKFNNSTSLAAGPFVYGSKRAVVPELEASLDVNYHWLLAQGGDLALNVGYMHVNYFNAQHNNLGLGITTATTAFNAESDFALSGPFVRLAYTGALMS